MPTGVPLLFYNDPATGRLYSNWGWSDWKLTLDGNNPGFTEFPKTDLNFLKKLDRSTLEESVIISHLTHWRAYNRKMRHKLIKRPAKETKKCQR